MEFAKWMRLQWDRALAWLCVLAGAAALIAGWIGVSKSAYSAEQVPYVISGGIGGMFLLGAGGILWLSADLKDEWRKLDRIEEAIRERGVVTIVQSAPMLAGNPLPLSRVAVSGPDPSSGVSPAPEDGVWATESVVEA